MAAVSLVLNLPRILVPTMGTIVEKLDFLRKYVYLELFLKDIVNNRNSISKLT